MNLKMFGSCCTAARAESGTVWAATSSKSRAGHGEIFIHLPDKDLAYFSEGSEHFDDYVEAVEWAQDFARWNRHL